MSRSRCAYLSILGLATLSAGCATSTRKIASKESPIQFASYTTSDSHTVYVVGHGWHTGIAVKTSDVSRTLWPEVGDFSDTNFVEVGWGDEGFYRAKRITPQLVLRAAFWPTPSVLHVAGFYNAPHETFEFSDIVEVETSRQEFDNLCEFIGDTFERDETGKSTDLGQGIYGDSLFYRAKGKYYVPKTCNIWTARALKAGGLAMTPAMAIRSENVIAQSRRFGRVIQESPSWIKRAALSGSE